MKRENLKKILKTFIFKKMIECLLQYIIYCLCTAYSSISLTKDTVKLSKYQLCKLTEKQSRNIKVSEDPAIFVVRVSPYTSILNVYYLFMSK